MDAEYIKPESESIIEKAKQSEAAGASAFMNPEPKLAKKGPGRPKGAKSETKSKDERPKDEPKKAFIETKVLCYPIAKAVSIAGVSYTGDPRAAMSPDEAEMVAGALGGILDKYLPDAMQSFGAEIALTVAMGQYGLRLYAIKKSNDDAKRRAEGARSQAEHKSSADVTDLATDVTPMQF